MLKMIDSQEIIYVDLRKVRQRSQKLRTMY
jgi:hypothetical protein